ncbi:hypothetical protein KOW79_016044 [Hemibagrus wyckioides]|uniref:Uncharacterized protein n=1 Tax=Hemibagrus wyckioides TaxID=337641 RepID=A0A9D3NCG3_9TELE|nr:hypothetical protein KOW79_016044 [Hemibagrus wyckioides]
MNRLVRTNQNQNNEVYTSLTRGDLGRLQRESDTSLISDFRTDVSTAVQTQHVVRITQLYGRVIFRYLTLGLYSDLLSHPYGRFSSESSRYGSEVPRRIAVVKIRDKEKDVSYVSGSQMEQ